MNYREGNRLYKRTVAVLYVTKIYWEDWNKGRVCVRVRVIVHMCVLVDVIVRNVSLSFI